MKLKGLVVEDFVQYKKPSMFIITPFCTFKCDKEAGCNVCQNSDLAAAPLIDVGMDDIARFYSTNPIPQAFVFGGLEPIDTFDDLYTTIMIIRETCMDDIVIYTGYYPTEIKSQLKCLSYIKGGQNIIVKFGRFIPNRPSRFDKILGVELASNNQFAVHLGDLEWEKLEPYLYRLEVYYKTMPPEDIKALEEKFNGN